MSSIFSLPNDIQEAKYPVMDIRHTVVPAAGEPCFEAPKFNSVCSPPGAITDPHIDAPGIGILVIHVTGQKLWLLWPPTPHNLGWMANHNDDAHPPYLTSALHHLTDLTVVLLTPGNRMKMKPGTIHAVLSLDTSAHLALDVCAKDDFRLAKSTMQWEIGWLKRMASSGRGIHKSNAITSLEILEIWSAVAEDEVAEGSQRRSKRRREEPSGLAADIEMLKGEYDEFVQAFQPA
jgi:hypothetical protein